MRSRTAALLFLHEVGQILADLRFAVIFAGLAALLAVTALPAATRFRLERGDQVALTQTFVAELRQSTIADFTDRRVPAVKPPWPLLFAVEGGQMAAPNRYDQELSTLWLPRLARTEEEDSRLPAVPPLDWMLVMRIALPLAAFVLCHDALGREREARSSRLVGSYPLTGGERLAGKFLAYWACLALPVSVGALASALWFCALTGVAFHAVGAKLACLLALGLWATALYVLVALWFASHIREAATCLTALLFAWVGAVVVVPAVADVAARRLLPVPSEVEVKRKLASIYERIHRGEFAGRSERWRDAEEGAADGYAGEKVSARAANHSYTAQERYRWQVLQAQLDQAQLARDLASVSPVHLAQNVAERLAGTGVGRERSFLDQVQAYRAMLAAKIRALDAADPKSPHLVYMSDYLSKRPLPAGAIAPFSFHERTLREGFAAAWGWLLVFLAETLLLVAVVRRAFAHPSLE